MGAGAITSQIDVAQLTLYAFWIFFIALVFYLHRENKREGYPLDSDASGRRSVEGWPGVPKPKIFHLWDGRTVQAPRPEAFSRPKNAVDNGVYIGQPLDPVGNPLLAGVGPGAWAERGHEPARTIDGRSAIVPIGMADDVSINEKDPDPRGLDVVALDGRVAGTVADVWVDLTEPQIRYLEVQTLPGAGGRRVLLPIYYAVVDNGIVSVQSITAEQFANVPVTARRDQISLTEEDKISAYFSAGNMWATPQSSEPLI
ncbi:MAG TPA: photosynthetic reaction center subunit H [Acidisphaera sp.]|nr:photosynthetic reaction center subunit H [Acidisphaera sp.]